jgi:hypothetical protein
MDVGQIGNISSIEAAVRRASATTGVDFGFLMRTAQRESGMSAGAHASTSSAAGLFQFVEQTWLSTLKRHGAAHGYARYAELIDQSPDGRFVVPQGDDARKVVMNLRYDPHASAAMAAELASDHAAYLRGRTGREPTGGELYAAHFLGPQGSAKLIEAAHATPAAAAAGLFPDAAASNREVFYRGGRAVTVAELYNNLSRTGGGGDAAIAKAVESDPGEGRFTAYAGAARTERLREQAMLVNFILTNAHSDDPTALDASSSGASSSAAAARSMFSSEMLSMLSSAQKAR